MKKNPKFNDSVYISTKSPHWLPVDNPAGIFSLAPVLLALTLTGEDFWFSTLTLMAFIPEAHGSKSCCEGFGLFPFEPKGFCFQMLLEVFSQRPELQPGMRRPGAPGTALCLFCKFRSPALNPRPPGGPGPYLEPQVGDLENKTHISWLLTPVFWQQTPSIPR